MAQGADAADSLGLLNRSGMLVLPLFAGELQHAQLVWSCIMVFRHLRCTTRIANGILHACHPFLEVVQSAQRK